MNPHSIQRYPVPSKKLLAALLALAGSVALHAQTTISWSGGSSTAWATDTNWVGGMAPANDLTSNIAQFNQATYTNQPNAGTTNIAGVQIGASSGAFTLSTTNLGIGSSGISKASGSGAFTLGAVTLGASQTWTNSSGSNFNINGAVGGDGVTLNLTSNGTGGKFSQNAKITATNTTINLTAGSYWEIGSAAPGNDAFGGSTNTVNVANGAQMKIAWNAESYNNNWTFNGGTGLSATSYSLRIDQAKLLGTITLGSGDTVFSAFNRTNSELRGQITGSGALTFGMKDAVTGNGATTVYNTANDWTGGLTIQSNNHTTTLNLGASGVLTDTGSVTFNNVSTTNQSYLDMKGFNETIDLLVSSGSSASAATGIVTNSGGIQSTLTLGGGSASSATFTGVIQDGTGGIALTKIGAGTQILSGSNTYTGATTVNAGTLALGRTNALSTGTAITLGGGTLNLGGFSQAAFTTALTVTNTSAIDFGTHSGGLTLTFADSSGVTWSGTLDLLNFTVGTDNLSFSSVGGLTVAQLADINLAGYTATGLDANGFVQFTASAIPEPSTCAAIFGTLALAGAAVRRRRRA